MRGLECREVKGTFVILMSCCLGSVNDIGAAGARDLGAAFAAGGLPQLTSLDLAGA